MTAAELLEGIRERDRKAAARAISWIEDDAPGAADLLDAIWPLTGNARRVGITGPPGAGKSTLVAALAGHMRAQDRTVGVICVDPTSPFTGGALLGDRIRMTRIMTDPGVFIRSMASRGALGGLARRSGEACDVLDALGKDEILIETVGVGQSEVEVAQMADTTVVVLSPESGDGVQTMKAGLMEIAEVFVVNKADREGADRMARAIDGLLEMDSNMSVGMWRPPVLRTTASSGEGVAELAAALEGHRKYLVDSGNLEKKRKARVAQKIRHLVEERLWALFSKAAAWEAEAQRWTGDVLAGKATPYAAAREMVERFRGAT